MLRLSPSALSASASRPRVSAHGLVARLAGWAMLLLTLPGCETADAIGGAGKRATGAAAETAYGKATDFIEVGSGKIVKTVIDGAGKLAGYVVFDAALRTPLYFVGLSSGPFSNRSEPTGLDKYLLNPMEDGYQKLVGWLGDGTSWTTETAVRVVGKGGQMLVESGGKTVGAISGDVTNLGTALYKDIPSFKASAVTPETLRRDAPPASAYTMTMPRPYAPSPVIAPACPPNLPPAPAGMSQKDWCGMNTPAM